MPSQNAEALSFNDVAQDDNESDAIDRLIEIIHEQRELIEELFGRLDSQEERIDDVEQQSEMNESRLNGACDSIDRIEGEIEAAEDQSSPSDPEGMDTEEGEVAASQIAQTPLERTTVLPEEICDYINDRRARHLAMDVKEYARSAKSGYILEPGDIADILYSREQTPAAAHDNTVSRVREILAEQGGDEVEIVDRGRKKIVHFTDEIVSRLSNLGKLRDRCPSLTARVCDDESGVRG